MTGITITSKDAERIAKSFAALIGPKGLNRIRRKAVNKIGSEVRKEAKAIAPAIFGTTGAALMIQGKAATPGSANPEYRLRMASSIAISRLRAKHRKTRRQGGSLGLIIDTPATDPIRFRATQRVGRAFKLLKAGPLPERFVGGLATKARTAFGPERDGGQAELNQLRKRAGADLPEAVAKAINDHLAKARKR